MNPINLFKLLSDAAEADPRAPFFYYQSLIISRGEAMDRIRRIAGLLRGRGVSKGDTIILYLGNVPEFIYSFFASTQIGAIAVLVNPAARRFELRQYCRICAPKLAITSEALVPNLAIDGDYFLHPSSIAVVEESSQLFSIQETLRRGEPLHEVEETGEDDTAAIIFTSAMDGTPLGAMLTHGGIYSSSREGYRELIGEGDVFLSVLPLFHSFGLTSSLFIPLSGGVPFHLVSRYSPRRIVEILRQGRTTIFCGVPVMFELLARVLPEGARFPRMKAWISGGESISIELQRNMERLYGIEIRQGYGLTEASPIVTWNRLGRPNRIGSIGLAMPYNEVRIAGPQGEAPPGAEGEIVVKGSNVIPGYFKRGDAGAAIMRHGWLHTGDIGLVDRDGYFFLTGRKKEMIIKKGFNVYPKEVEQILSNHPSIESVRVSGHFRRLEDNSFSETVEAEIIPHKGLSLSEDDFLVWCRDNISSYKIPDTLKIRS